MMHKKIQWVIGAALLSSAWVALAQKPIIYPAKGQSAAQQSKDDGECYVWAKQNSGYDPANPSQVAPATATAESQPARPRGGLIKGAAAGAAVGAIGGNDVGEAAVKGAVIGGVAQHARRRGQDEAATQQNKAAQQQQAEMEQSLVSTYQRAYAACMSGRGYTVN